MTVLRAPLVCVLVLAAAAADANTWRVGGPAADFPLIAPAIAAAAAGDVIEVSAGVYRENLVVDKPLRIVGVGRPVLFGTGVGSVVTLAAGGSEISGFAIEGSGRGDTNQMDAGIQVMSSGNVVARNSMRRVFYGIVVAEASRNQIVDNDIHGLSDLPFGRRGDGIYLYRAPENIVERNTVAGERDAIYFQYAPRGRAVDNVTADSRYGLHDMFSDDTVIAGNVFRDSAVGANIMNSRRIRLEGNRLLRNRGVPGIGLTLKDCDDSDIHQNVVAGNARGLLIDGSSSNRFDANEFISNDTAVTLFSSAEGNTFWTNTFDGNWSDVVLSGRDSGTRWSKDGIGNTWTRYRGFDFDGDGIGDAPHPVVGAFEQIEGANALSRLFLQSPAAAGLELAARLGAPSASDTVDDRPITATCRPVRTVGTAGLFAAGMAGAACFFRRRRC
jgi:nitrous oxidase accessory protein